MNILKVLSMIAVISFFAISCGSNDIEPGNYSYVGTWQTLSQLNMEVKEVILKLDNDLTGTLEITRNDSFITYNISAKDNGGLFFELPVPECIEDVTCLGQFPYHSNGGEILWLECNGYPYNQECYSSLNQKIPIINKRIGLHRQ